MLASALYGVILGAAFVVLGALAPQPAGSIVLWGFFALQLARGATICWRRTALPYATAAMAVGAATSAALAALAAAGFVFPHLPRPLWIAVLPGLAAGPLLLLIESRVNSARWRRWADYMERVTAWDILLGRHIPQLRDT